MDLIKKMQEYSDLISGTGARAEEVQKAETSLHLQFSKEYREYLTVFGIAAVNGHELTGISKSQRINVIDVTKEQRGKFPIVTESWYVIEEANIDGIVVWQSNTGEIYQTMPNAQSAKLCNSLYEYLEL